MNDSFIRNIFKEPSFNEALALRLAEHQYQYCEVYQSWCNLLKRYPTESTGLLNIPFLPISFFKTHLVTTNHFQPEIVFTSSGTTQTVNSQHLVKNVALYEQSFIKAFELFYGSIKDLCIIGLLPSYLERNGSSLVYMVDKLIQLSEQSQSGFYLYNFEQLRDTLLTLEARQKKTVLIGVTFALLDFAAACPIPLQHTIIIETGGMKGRKKELTREEVHAGLQQAFGVCSIHSEYGMTELLSQAYSKGKGRYHCPPWMKVLIRSEDDPLQISATGRGILNIVDLANKDSCAFLATDDAGIVYEDGSFEVLGRIDNSDLRGCSLLTL